MVPAETTLKYILPGNGTDVYVDLMRDLAAVNRRGMHQGQCLRISHITIRQDTPPGLGTYQSGVNVTVKRLPYTWTSAQAYMKARGAWYDQQNQVAADSELEGIRPTWEDFKVYMDAGHRSGTTIPTLDGANNSVVYGEWEYSKLVYADQSVDPEVVLEPHLHMIGGDVFSTDVGLINAYEDSRSTVQAPSPNVPGAASSNIYALLSAGSDDGASEEVIANMEIENDAPPYSKSNYLGGAVNYPTNVDAAYLQTSSSNPIVHSQGMVAMCGLLRFYSQGKKLDLTTPTDPSWVDSTIPATILVHLVPGPAKGVLSMNVGELV